MMTHLARAIVHRYPAAWRERYEDEMQSLIEAGPIRLGDVCGLLRHCITERTLALYEPSRHLSAFRLISGIALVAYITVLFLAVLVIGSIPFTLGYLIQRAAGPLPTEWLNTISWVYLPVFVVLVVPAFIRFFRLQLARMNAGTPLPPRAARLRWTIIGAYAGLTFLGGLQTDLSFRNTLNSVAQSWVLVYMLWDLPEDIDRHWPGRGLFEMLGRLRSARYDLRWARMELERCEGMYEGREPGPELRAARAEMERLTQAEADAIAALDAMGYHARFAA